MANEGDIKRYSATELREMCERGEDRTNWARIDAMTEEELEQSIADDPDWKDIPRDWHKDAKMVDFDLIVDADVVDWFIKQGPGYQARINAVLREYVERTNKA